MQWFALCVTATDLTDSDIGISTALQSAGDET